ncbi:MAG: MFS transporter, partial [Caulobacteraceae bacterium]
MSSQAQGAPRLGVVSQSLYGLSSLGTAAKSGVTGTILLFFYNELVGLEATTVSLALSIALLIDAFWDPIVGRLSDSVSTRLGRRHPFIYAAALPVSICTALVFMPPLEWPAASLFFFLLFTIIGQRMFDSFVEIPMAALMPELSRDYDKRTTLTSWRFVFASVIGRVVVTILLYGVFLKGTKAHPYGQMNIAGYAPFALTMAAIAFVATLASAFSTQRFARHFPVQPRRKTSWAEARREVFTAPTNRNFVALAVSGLIFGFAVAITGGLLSYFLTYFWELPSSALLKLGLWIIPGGLIGVVLAPYAARVVGKKPACLTVFFISIFSTTVPIGLRLLGVMPPNSSPWVLRILIIDSLCTGLFSTLGFIIVTSMLADVVEEIQVKTGKRSEGLLFAADSFLRKVTTGVAAMAPGLILAFVRFPR